MTAVNGGTPNNQLARRRTDALATNAQQITYPRPMQLFTSSELTKREAIIAAITRLAALTKATTDAGLLLAYADNLEDLSSEVLALTFQKAEKECKFLPTPKEFREMALPIANELFNKAREKQKAAEQRQIQAARDRGETIGLADVLSSFKESHPEAFVPKATVEGISTPAVIIPTPLTSDAEYERRRRELQEQARQLKGEV